MRLPPACRGRQPMIVRTKGPGRSRVGAGRGRHWRCGPLCFCSGMLGQRLALGSRGDGDGGGGGGGGRSSALGSDCCSGGSGGGGGSNRCGHPHRGGGRVRALGSLSQDFKIAAVSTAPPRRATAAGQGARMRRGGGGGGATELGCRHRRREAGDCAATAWARMYSDEERVSVGEVADVATDGGPTDEYGPPPAQCAPDGGLTAPAAGVAPTPAPPPPPAPPCPSLSAGTTGWPAAAPAGGPPCPTPCRRRHRRRRRAPPPHRRRPWPATHPPTRPPRAPGAAAAR